METLNTVIVTEMKTGDKNVRENYTYGTVWKIHPTILVGKPEAKKLIGRRKQTNKLHGLSPRANYTDRATAACRRSERRRHKYENNIKMSAK
jgi:hypothetical protein